ncbi:MAG: RdgB/HAM1 family non-canonical purine NTP pyrophosphatase [Phycisphaerales bacterium]|nr:RdgB/HAM1 family non-canonical purine NTP pyrophosphatase [Phycisphaerales bacterium]
MSTIVLATQNPGKVAELRSLLQDSSIEILGLSDLSDSFPEPDETGQTFLENATIKAQEYAKLTGKHCLADDSGLMIDAIGGRPGVISSHYAFNGETDGRAAALSRQQRDEHNIDRVLAELDGVELEDRSARFVCVMVLADPSGEVIATSEGTFEGRIGFPIDEPNAIPSETVPRGDHGFGYDPIFLVHPDYLQTSAELEPAEKNAISHRGAAVRAMIEHIKGLALDS